MTIIIDVTFLMWLIGFAVWAFLGMTAARIMDKLYRMSHKRSTYVIGVLAGPFLLLAVFLSAWDE